MVDKPAPDFSLTLFSGEKVELKDFRGKVVVLNFWHSA
jgi:peroxiredoxin